MPTEIHRSGDEAPPGRDEYRVSPRASRSWTNTLRFRLMVWNAVVVLVTVLVTLIGLREGVRITLVSELDQMLIEDLRELELSLVSYRVEDTTELRSQLDRKASGQLRNTSGLCKFSVRTMHLSINRKRHP